MATIFKDDFTDTNYPDRVGGPAGTAWNDELDNTMSSLFNPEVGDWNTDYNPNDVSPDGNYSKIISVADKPGGVGKVFRHYKWETNGLSAAMRPKWTTEAVGVTEYWHRWYARFQSGWEWNSGSEPHYMKWNYVDIGGGFKKSIVFGLYGSAPDGHVAWGLQIVNHDDGSQGNTNYPSDTSWYISQGNSLTGSGAWHCYEYHVKMNSNSSTADGVFEFWFDGTRTANYTNLSFWTQDNPKGWQGMIFPDNQNLMTPAGTSYYVDITRIEAVDSGGPIGPLNATVAPSFRRGSSIDGLG